MIIQSGDTIFLFIDAIFSYSHYLTVCRKIHIFNICQGNKFNLKGFRTILVHTFTYVSKSFVM